MNRILVGVDGSPESKQAAELATQLAGATGAKLTLVYIARAAVPLGPESYALVYADWEQAEREYGKGVLREMTARCTRPNVPLETRLEGGPPAEAIADLATELKADLVAVGHRGRGRAQRFLLGSVADRLAQIAPCPVLVCRTEGHDGHAA